jgi:hypothetical protein
VFTVDYDYWGATNYFDADRVLDDVEKMAPALRG